MNLNEVLSQIDVWDSWKNRYKSFVPKFILEAQTKPLWSDWDKEVFFEYFERSNGQCVSSLQQGYFTKEEQKNIKDNWLEISPLLKQIAKNTTQPAFKLYAETHATIRKFTNSNRNAASHRLIAGLQPNFLTTICKQDFLNELYNLLKTKADLDIKDFSYSNWYKASYQILSVFKTALPLIKTYDIITYPWQTLEYLRDNDFIPSKMTENLKTIIELLEYKKQIILQGPPGTGKTKLAKEIAKGLIQGEKSIDAVSALSDQHIIDVLKGVTLIPTAANLTSYELLGIDESKKEVLLKKGTGKEDNTPFEKIKEHYHALSWEKYIPSNDARRAIAIAKFIFDKIGGGINLETNQSDQFRLIQFHPSYTYEDFVRGIISKPNPDGTGVIYEAQNKILANFANDALQNWKAFNNPTTLLNEKWLQDTIDDFLEYLSEKTEAEPKSIKLTEKTYISRITENAIRYNSDVWEVDGGVPISDLIKMYDSKVTTRNEVKSMSSLTKTAKHLPSYWVKILELFKKYISDNNLRPEENAISQKLNKYVLIIDEINRANLSSVLGELIYALEYRDESVDSMYEVRGNNKLILPSNLYIIGTMNTADRSVGHIDYAIRRRFAFVDILPKILFDVPFEIELFKQVTTLFIKDMETLTPSTYLSTEFRPQDVWLGHSYFIKKDEVDSKLRLKYEIIPILEEYIKDGVLKESDDLKIAIGNLENFLQ